MAYSQMLRKLFPDIALQAEDLLLLETFQINYLPGRVAKKEFAALLRNYPVVHRFLVNKNPPIDSFLSELLEENVPLENTEKLEEYCQEALWEIADLIIYNKHPDLYDSLGGIRWDIEEITSITSLEGKIVADIGAGSGRIAFLVSPFVKTVYAVEPITSFRSFIKEKADKQGTKNLYVMDGTLDSIPLPADSLNVLITSNAIGWNLDHELKEIERVVKPGGYAIHLLKSEAQHENPYHEVLTSAPWHYEDIQRASESTLKIIYHKKMGASAT